jgi:hypothetical protein
MWKGRGFLALSAIGLFCVSVGAQTPAVPETSPFDIIANVKADQFPDLTVMLNVRDMATGKAATGLSEKEFSLQEDLVPVIPSSCAETSTPRETKKVDVMFVFDQTGSMSEEINALIKKTMSFAMVISQSGIDYSLGLVTFSDIVEKKFGYCSSSEEFKKNLQTVTANGGDDEPENQLDALMYSLDSCKSRPGSRRIFILVTDAPFHALDKFTRNDAQSVCKTLKKAGVELDIVGPDIDPYHWMSAECGGNFYDKDGGDFNEVIRKLAGQAGANYVIKFRTNRTEFDGTWRGIEVSITKSSKTVTGAAQYRAKSWVQASSRLDEMKGDESAFLPFNGIDGKTATKWISGSAGDGSGEWLLMNFANFALGGIRFKPAGSGYSYPQNISVVLPNGKNYSFIMTDKDSVQSFAFPSPQTVSSIKIEVASVHPGSKKTGFSEIELYGDKPDALLPEIAQAHEIARGAALAQELNQKGVTLYHAKKMDDAIFNYKEALKKDPTFAQGWSNLGLAFQKKEMFPEAISANRKAISFAKGSTSSVVKASSYYNIGRIFESQQKYEQALQCYWWCEHYKSASVYQQAIARMNEKIGKRF